MRLMHAKSPIIKLVIFGKIKRMINSYGTDRLDKKDQRLLKGIYYKKDNDFDEEWKEK